MTLTSTSLMSKQVIEADFHSEIRVVPGKVTDITLLQVSGSPPFESEVVFRRRFTQTRSVFTATPGHDQAAISNANAFIAHGFPPASIGENIHEVRIYDGTHDVQPEQDIAGSHMTMNQAQNVAEDVPHLLYDDAGSIPATQCTPTVSWLTPFPSNPC